MKSLISVPVYALLALLKVISFLLDFELYYT